MGRGSCNLENAKLRDNRVRLLFYVVKNISKWHQCIVSGILYYNITENRFWRKLESLVLLLNSFLSIRKVRESSDNCVATSSNISSNKSSRKSNNIDGKKIAFRNFVSETRGVFACARTQGFVAKKYFLRRFFLTVQSIGFPNIHLELWMRR